MFNSGIAKLRERCPKWMSLSAMQYHYETQPIPTWLAFYLHMLPAWFQRATTAATLLLEVGVPFLLLMPSRAAWAIATAGFMILSTMIHASGNVGIFNILTMVLSLTALDDDHIAWMVKFIPSGFRNRFAGNLNLRTHEYRPRLRSSVHLFVVLALLFPALVTVALPILSSPHSKAGPGLVESPVVSIPSWMLKTYVALLPSWLGQAYSPFARIITHRWESLFEGSYDGKEWLPYSFNIRRNNSCADRPQTNWGHEWRLDQLMQSWPSNVAEGKPLPPWFERFLRLLLTNSKQVSSVLENPFRERTPPRFIRVSLWDFHFSSCRLEHLNQMGYSFPVEHRASTVHNGSWWWRGKVEDLFTVTLQNGNVAPADRESTGKFYKLLRGAVELRPEGRIDNMPADIISFGNLARILAIGEVPRVESSDNSLKVEASQVLHAFSMLFLLREFESSQ